MAAVVSYSHPTQLPSTLSIGTKKAFAGGYEYNYRVADDINVCVWSPDNYQVIPTSYQNPSTACEVTQVMSS